MSFSPPPTPRLCLPPLRAHSESPCFVGDYLNQSSPFPKWPLSSKQLLFPGNWFHLYLLVSVVLGCDLVKLSILAQFEAGTENKEQVYMSTRGEVRGCLIFTELSSRMVWELLRCNCCQLLFILAPCWSKAATITAMDRYKMINNSITVFLCGFISCGIVNIQKI